MGRPATYSEEIAAAILEQMATGATLRSICRVEGMPPESTVRLWAINDTPPGFAARFARARDIMLGAYEDDIIEISDDTAADTHVTVYEDGHERTSPNTEWISRSKLRVDSRKWLMSKLAPKKYGDRLEVDQKTQHSVDDSVGALFERIGSQGKRIHDKSGE